MKKEAQKTVEQMKLISSALATDNVLNVDYGKSCIFYYIALCKLQFTSTTTAHCRFQHLACHFASLSDIDLLSSE